MTAAGLTIATVVYHTDFGELEGHLRSVQRAAQMLHDRLGVLSRHYVIDNSVSATYRSQLAALLARFGEQAFYQLESRTLPANNGYGRANNVVIQELSSAFHLVINPDVLVEPEALWHGVEFLQQHPRIGMLTPRVNNPKSAVPHVVKNYPSLLVLSLRYLRASVLQRQFAAQMADYERSDLDEAVDSSVLLAGGCFMLMRTPLFRLLGGFDPRFFMYFEDYDLCLRMRDHASVAYVPAVVIGHSGGDVGRKTVRHHRSFITSMAKFFNCHGWRVW